MDTKFNITIRAEGGVDKYPAKSHAQRVAAKLSPETKLILLRGEKAEKWTGSDLNRAFRQDRSFYYLTGCNVPGCWVTYNVHQDKLTLWLPPIDLDRVFYDGRTPTVEEAMDKYDIDEARYLKGKKIRSNLAQYVRATAQGGSCSAMKIPRLFLGKKIMESLTDDSFRLDLKDAIIACRAVKDEHEISLIRTANEVSAKAHINILKNLHLLESEFAVAGVYTGSCVAQNAQQQSYDPICGAGPNASQLHYFNNADYFGDSQVLLVDAGAEWQCYASDVSRTMPINPAKPGYWQSKEAESVYECVAKIQETCIKELGPGVSFMNVAWRAIHMAIDALVSLGILKGRHMDIFHAGTALAFFPHGLGHHMGLEVHDLPPPARKQGKRMDQRFTNVREAYKAFVSSTESASSFAIVKDPKMPKRMPKHFSMKPRLCLSPNTPSDPLLEPGMIVTVEPGIYFNEFWIENYYLNDPTHLKFIDRRALAKYMHVGGVRIEDDILITKKGYENLTTAPKGNEMLQIIRDADNAYHE